MRNAGIALIGIGAALAVFGLFIGVEAGYRERIMHLPSGIAGGTLLICGVMLFGFSEIHEIALSMKEARTRQDFEHDPKWKALVEYDSDVYEAARAARGWGREFEREMARAYLALDDKTFLPIIIQKLEEESKRKNYHSTVFARSNLS